MDRWMLAFFLVSSAVYSGCSEKAGALLKKMPGIQGSERFLPDTGEVPGLERTTRKQAFLSDGMIEYLGPNARIYIQYSAQSLATADYTLGGADRMLTVESYVMETEVAAAGIFHYFRGARLKQRGQAVDVGAEGLLDTDHESRNLYFYKKNVFIKLIYSGKDPVPDLLPLARMIERRMPGESAKPRGFEYLAVDGVSLKNRRVSAGFTFGYDFLPPGIHADAPGSGPIAEVFLIWHPDNKDAKDTERNYKAFLQLHGKDYSQKIAGRQIYWYGRDPNQGRVICTIYKNYLIGVLRPKTYRIGEEQINKILEKMRGQ